MKLTAKFLGANLIVVFLNSVAVHSACSLKECCSDSGYYWREYDGEIPPDAIPGARDKTGNIIYIGQVLHDESAILVPGEIRQREKKIYYQFYGMRSATENVKILCSVHPEFYQWAPTSINAIDDLQKSRKFVVAGYEDDEILYVGRAFHGGEQIMGKINAHYRVPEYRALYAADPSKDVIIKDNFEVLTYNPETINEESDYNTVITISFYNNLETVDKSDALMYDIDMRQG